MEVQEKILEIRLRIVNDRAANARMLAGLRSEVDAVLNPAAKSGGLAAIAKAQVDAVSGTLRAARATEEASERKHQQNLIAITKQGIAEQAKARADAVTRDISKALPAVVGAPTAPLPTARPTIPTAIITNPQLGAATAPLATPLAAPRPTAPTEDTDKLLRARIRLLKADGDLAEAERQLAVAFGQTVPGTLASIRAETELLNVQRQRRAAEAGAQREAASRERATERAEVAAFRQSGAIAREAQQVEAAANRQVVAQARALASRRDYVGAENVLQAALERTQGQTLRTAQLEAALSRVRQQAANEQRASESAAQASQRRAENEAARLTQARTRLALSSKNYAEAERTLQAALRGAEAGTQRAIQLESQLIAVRQRAAREAQREANRPRSIVQRLSAPDIREAGESVQQSGAVFQRFLTDPILKVGAASQESAKDIDVFRSRLTAFEGSAAGANKRLEELRRLSAGAPGVTFKAAADQFALLRGTTELVPQSIERVIKSVGRLNAAFKLDDPQRFIRNLQQIFTQNFELPDIKEAQGQVPIFTQLLKRAFGTDDREQLRALKAQGKLTGESFFAGIAQAIETDSRLANVQENIASRFEKLRGRAEAALEPLGIAILNVLEPAVSAAVPLIEGLGGAFAALPAAVQLTVVGIGAATAAIGPFLEVFGGVVQAFQVFRVVKVVEGLAETVAAMRAAQAAATATTVATVAMESQLATAGTAIGTTAAAGTASFAALGPILLGVVAILGVAALATTTYASETEKASKITLESIGQLSAQQKEYQGQIDALNKVASAQGSHNTVSQQLNQTLATLDPVTRNYANGLGTVKEQADAASGALVRLQAERVRPVLDANERQFAAAIRESVAAIDRASGELTKLGRVQREFEADVKNGSTAMAQFTEGQYTSADALAITDGAVRSQNKAIADSSTSLAENIAKRIANTEAAGGNVQALYEEIRAQAQSSDALKVINDGFKNYINVVEQATSATFGQVSALGELQAALDKADVEAAGNATRARVKQLAQTAAISGRALTKSEASSIVSSTRQNEPAFNAGVRITGAAQENERLFNELLFPTPRRRSGGGGGGGRARSTVESTTQAVKRLREEVAALEAGTGKLFDLELQREELTTVQGQLKEIIKLRRQLGENTRVPLPRTEGGREQELLRLGQFKDVAKLRRELGQDEGALTPQAQTARETLLRQLSREKQTSEEIARVTDAQFEAEAKLSVLRAREAVPLATQEVRVETVLSERRLQLQQEEAEAAAKKVIAQRALIGLLGDEVRIRRAARQSLEAEPDTVFTSETRRRIVLETQVASLQESALVNEFERSFALKEQNNVLEEQKELILSIASFTARAGVQRNNPNQELFNRDFALRDDDQRREQERRSIAEVANAESRLAALRSGSTAEFKSANIEADRSRVQSALSTAQQLVVIRQQERDGFTQSVEFIKQAQERAELSRRTAAQSTAEEIIRLQDEIANAAEGSAQRYEAAYLRAVRNIQLEDERANQQLVENQLKLARQTEIRYGRLNDSVSNLLASQKGLTESLADFRANLAQDAFNGIEKGVDALTKKFGIVGSAVNQLLKDLLKLAASKAFQALFGLNQSSPSGAAGSNLGGLLRPAASGSGGGGGILQQLASAFSPQRPQGAVASAGGGSFGGVGSFGSFSTPGFNPNASLPGGLGGSGGGFQVPGLPRGVTTGNIRTLLSKIPGLGRLFGSRVPNVGNFGLTIPSLGTNGAAAITPSGLNLGNFAVSPPAGFAPAAAAAPSAFAGLGATGLLAGGGILGSFAGGQSQIGRLLGSAGGALGLGALGATGIFGGGVAAALPAFFTNPITAVVAGGLIAGALIARSLANRDLKRLSKTVQAVHAVNIPVKGTGLAALKAIKEIGIQRYGKQWEKERDRLVKLEPVEAIILNYAESTNQSAPKLTRKRDLLDPNSAANNFVQNPVIERRNFGGVLPMAATRAIFPTASRPAERVQPGVINAPRRGYDHVPLFADGGEYVVRASRTAEVGARALDALNTGAAQIVRNEDLPFDYSPVRRNFGGIVPARNERGRNNAARLTGAGARGIAVPRPRNNRLPANATGLTINDIVQRTRMAADLRRAAERGGAFGTLFTRLAVRIENELESVPQRPDLFFANRLAPVRRIAGGIIPRAGVTPLARMTGGSIPVASRLTLAAPVARIAGGIVPVMSAPMVRRIAGGIIPVARMAGGVVPTVSRFASASPVRRNFGGIVPVAEMATASRRALPVPVVRIAGGSVSFAPRLAFAAPVRRIAGGIIPVADAFVARRRGGGIVPAVGVAMVTRMAGGTVPVAPRLRFSEPVRRNFGGIVPAAGVAAVAARRIAFAPIKRMAGGFIPAAPRFTLTEPVERIGGGLVESSESRPRTASEYFATEGREDLRAVRGTSSNGSAPLAPGNNRNDDGTRQAIERIDATLDKLVRVVDGLARATGNIESIKPGEVLTRGSKERPNVIPDSLTSDFRRRGLASDEIRRENSNS